MHHLHLQSSADGCRLNQFVTFLYGFAKENFTSSRRSGQPVQEVGRGTEEEGRSGGGGGEEVVRDMALPSQNDVTKPPPQENIPATLLSRPTSSLRYSGSEEEVARPRRSKSRSPRCSTSENLQMLNLREHYEIDRDLGRGTYGKVVQATCKDTGTKIALKILPKSSTKLRDFQREFNFSYYLSPHANIVDSYNVAFETRASYVFALEYVPMGDLFDFIPPQIGMSEANTKLVIRQISSAVEFMHSKKLVHRDIKPENILVMCPDFSRVKLMDFGMTRREGAMVRKTNGSIPYTPPEVCEAVRNESILVTTGADVWATSVLLFCMLTGNFPWENADIGDVYFKEFILWQRRKTTKIPSQWRKFSPRILKFFRKTLDIKPNRRSSAKEISKYISDPWLMQATDISEQESDSGTESEQQVDQLSLMLRDHGIDTRVDKRLRERRISEWLLSL
ncbi:serine/threonine-protein kinase SBK1 [Aplysia californica]|uniref:Serine/threonine-protein kinase SBK1 n=1 Tax=Aplysia californica TaxID=6500 RepID=A0ABM0K4G7_APLCA|nr:serine/threonine-protein kinase SBK1 [Aplysia californica]